MRHITGVMLAVAVLSALAWHAHADGDVGAYTSPNSCSGYSSPVTQCQYFQQACTCDTLVAQGYLPPGVVSLSTEDRDGNWDIGGACGAKLFKKTLFGKCSHDSAVPILATIVNDQYGSAAYIYGAGAVKASLKVPKACNIIYCYLPQKIAPSVTKTAKFVATPSTAPPVWTLTKTAAFAPPATGASVTLFNGDTQQASWTLNVGRNGPSTTFAGSVQGVITINNPTNYQIAVTSVIDKIQGSGGPQARVTCPAGVPLKIGACASVQCTYVASYSTFPSAGTYTNVATVTYNGLGYGTDTAQGAANFVVGDVASTPANVYNGGAGQEAGGIVVGPGATPTTPSTVAGRATVVDNQSPDSPYVFTASGSVGYTTDLTCPATGPVTNTATLTASTGQVLTAQTTLNKVCYALTVRVANAAPAVTGSYTWKVKKTCSPPNLTLNAKQEPYQTYYQKPVYAPKTPAYTPMVLYKPYGRRLQGLLPAKTYTFSPAAPPAMYQSSVVGTSTCRVEFTRTNPPGFIAGVPSYAVNGDIFIQNPAPINANLRTVRYTVTGTNGISFAGVATCPSLVVAAGGTLQCKFVATPSFDPTGATIMATASLANRANGQPSGKYTDFKSSAMGAMTGGGIQIGRRKMQQFTFFPPTATNAPTDAPGIGAAPFGMGASPVTNAAPTPVPASGSQVGVSPDGIMDQCADISDTFTTPGSSPIAATVVSGTVPAGRICGSQTFIYKLQFGPYNQCSKRVWTNTARLVTADTNTAAQASATININVIKCLDAAQTLMLSVAGVNANPQGGYAWTVKHTADRSALSMAKGATGTVSFTVAVQRSSSPKGLVSGQVYVANPTTIPVSIKSASYIITQSCSSTPSTGVVSCRSNTVPPASQASGPGVLSCSFSGPVPCSGSGSVQIIVTAASGLQLSSLPTALKFVVPKGNEAAKSQCASISDLGQAGGVTGKLVSGTRPSGNVCSSKTFTYKVAYGPYNDCAARTITRTATLKASATATSKSNVPINLAGCNPTPPTPARENAQAPRGSGCVSQNSFWASCLAASRPSTKCTLGYAPLPAGANSLFFSSGMSFKAILNSMSGTPYITAAKQYAAAQLNLLSGASMPDAVTKAYMSMGQALAGRSASATVSGVLQANLMSWGNTLASFNKGSFQGSAPAC